MKEQIIKYIKKHMERDQHYLSTVSRKMGINYFTLYRIVHDQRGGTADSLEKMIKWYNKRGKK